VWDWNGTLLDDLALIVESVNASLARLGEDRIDAAAYRQHFERPLHSFYERLLGRRVDDRLLHAIDDTFHAHYWQSYPNANLTADAVAAVDLAERRGATQSVASMMPHASLVVAVSHFGLDIRMLAVDGHRGHAGETKTAHLAEHVERLRSMYPDIGRVVAVGDVVDDAAAARAAGIDCVLYDGGSQTREALEATRFPVVDTLVEAVEQALG
jgi:phosphoglycolate phosphatase-like HAD superfamily hydrolase